MSSGTGDTEAAEAPDKQQIPKITWWASRKTMHLKREIVREIGLLVALLLLLLILSLLLHVQYGELADKIGGWLSNDNGRKVVLCVFPKSGVVNPVLDALGFKGDSDTVVLSDGVDMKLLVEDQTPAETLTHVKERLKDKNVVLLVAHERSSTMTYMNENLYEKEPFPAGQGPVPIILLAVTNPSITEGQRKSDGTAVPDRRHILRLPATDKIQADLLRQFFGIQKTVDITLLVDTTNPSYSKYLAAQMVATDSGEIALPVVNSFGVNISGEGFSPSRFLQKEPRLLFVGMETEGSILLRSLKHNGVDFSVTTDNAGKVHIAANGVLVAFTDGVAGAVFDSARRQILGDNDLVFLTGPFVPDQGKGKDVAFPDYRPLALGARELAGQLLREASRQGGVTRASVLNALQGHLGNGVPQRLGGIEMQFDEKGDNLKGQAHLFEITRQGVRHSLACTCSF